MGRLSYDKLEKLKKKYGVDRIWSYSRVSTYMTSKFEYYLKYVIKEKEDRQDCGYAPLGTICHDTLDDYYEGKIEYDDMLGQFDDGWTNSVDMAGLMLDRNDVEHDKKLKQKYKYCIEMFFKNHEKYKYDLMIEKPITAMLGNNLFIGYIDAVYRDDDGVFNIIDFKTSSKYSGQVLIDHSGQLITYALGLHQKGVPMDKIRCCFNFLKYATVDYEQANGKVKSRNVERCAIGSSLQNNANMWLRKLGYEEDADMYLKALDETNDICVLPEDVQKKYAVHDCHVYISLEEDIVNEWVNRIIETIDDIEGREKGFKESYDITLFWDDEEAVQKESYYFATLCGYSANKHLPYKHYLETLEDKKNGVDSLDTTKVESIASDNLDWLNDVL